MPAQIRSPWSAILQLVRTELVARTGLGSHLVFLRARGRTPSTHPVQGTQHLVVRCSTPSPLPGWFEAGGRVQRLLRRIVAVEVWTPQTMDAVDRDDNWLLSATGHYALEEKVLDALDGFAPTDADANLLTSEPMRYFEGGEAPDKEEPVIPQWGHSVFPFEVQYLAALDQARQ